MLLVMSSIRLSFTHSEADMLQSKKYTPLAGYLDVWTDIMRISRHAREIQIEALSKNSDNQTPFEQVLRLLASITTCC
jgi:hypothetical protein